ncbi:MAG TPA: ATP-grasp domain-containing protein, partial [Gaiellaceae bacterium]|nr:ATP-grasp domain-containing protein [Gaiellaceae bacterium]
LFDKPDPLNGPYFEETLYVTPSQLASSTQERVATTISSACRALGLREGPVHAEARITAAGDVQIIEAAARTIGGKCSKALQFSSGTTLEELVLRRALGEWVEAPRLEGASGVMMLPIHASGRLSRVEGRDRALDVPGVTALEISIPIGHCVQALPEGDRYLGFLFARASTPGEVELALRRGYDELEIVIDPASAGGAPR